MSQSIDFQLIDIPIEFKEINPSDFDSRYYNVEDKIVIEPNDDDDGFISDSLMPILHKGFDEKNTVVINAGVGQGKSTAILGMASKYSNTGNHVVIIAVPSHNLIEQYVSDCQKFISKSKIFNQLEIGQKKDRNIFDVNDDDDFNSKNLVGSYSIHILTTDGLLGNPGDENLFQAKVKREYFEELQSYCLKSKRKLVIIFDEIHDSIRNFKQELIVNLWNYQGLVSKIFAVSATFNEASKEVIKYLSELTDKRIQIIESKRIIKPGKQSELYLNFYSDQYVERDKGLINLLEELTENNLSFDIVVYSSTLTKKLISQPLETQKYYEVNNVLQNRKLNKCYFDYFDWDANQKYSNSRINIGTNFTTGVNIEKTNHNYVVIFPKDISIEYFNNKGIFTTGHNAIIQTLARQRKVGKIHVFLPIPMGLKPDSLKKFDKLTSEKMISNFTNAGFQSHGQVKYSDINDQKEILDSTYQEMKSRVNKALVNLDKDERLGMNFLEYPKIELFKLYKGETYLSKDYFEGNISTYFIWAAMCNQFLNCRLTELKVNKEIRLTHEELELEVKNIYSQQIKFLNSFYGEFNLYNSLSLFEKWEYFEDYFFKSHVLLVNGLPISNRNKQKTITVLLMLILGKGQEINKKQAYSNYLKSSIFHSGKSSTSLNYSINPERVNVIQSFKDWTNFLDIIKKNVLTRDNRSLISASVPKEFNDLFSKKQMKTTLNFLLKTDIVLSNKHFPFYDRFRKNTTDEQFAKSFYKLLIEIVYNVTKSVKVKVEGNVISMYEVNLEDGDFSETPNIMFKPVPEVTL